jgi:hypothetical protein
VDLGAAAAKSSSGATMRAAAGCIVDLRHVRMSLK